MLLIIDTVLRAIFGRLQEFSLTPTLHTENSRKYNTLYFLKEERGSILPSKQPRIHYINVPTYEYLLCLQRGKHQFSFVRNKT